MGTRTTVLLAVALWPSVCAGAPAAASMKSFHITRYGTPDEVLEMTTHRERPSLTKGKGEMLIKVHAVSLTPGDQRRMSGDVRGAPITLPPFPYVPCGDVCGTVLEVDESEPNLKFTVGDCVVATWDEAGVGGLAEYMLVFAPPPPTKSSPPFRSARASCVAPFSLRAHGHLSSLPCGAGEDQHVCAQALVRKPHPGDAGLSAARRRGRGRLTWRAGSGRARRWQTARSGRSARWRWRGSCRATGCWCSGAPAGSARSACSWRSRRGRLWRRPPRTWRC